MDFSHRTFRNRLHRTLRNKLGVFVAVCVLALAAHAQGVDGADAQADTGIKNFGQMDARFYRGAQPKSEEDFRRLAALGIKTVIDLRHDAKKYERPIVESLGMRYVNIPMRSKTRPTDEQAREFLRVVSDPATGKFFVHCAGGRHRTGAMGAVYRYEHDNWNFDQVYAEMKRYDFYTRNRHESYKEFVKDYYERKRAGESPVRTTSSPASPATRPRLVGSPAIEQAR